MTNDDQYNTLLNAVTAATSVSPSFTVQDGVDSGSIQITTSSTFNGSTSTAVLKGSNDNSNFTQVYQSDGTTAMSFTLAAASTNYSWLMGRVLYKFYQLVYTKGDATLGTVTANFIGKK